MPAEKLILQNLKGKSTPMVPFWFMRQAGRYLPEYREVRASTKGFLDLCFTPEKAAEVTLQPLRRFNMDAAILFSDILVIPYALGIDVKFVEGEGPRVGITDSAEKISRIDPSEISQRLAPIAETVRLVKKQMPQGAALIGFAGAPWTVACYMLQGRSGNDFAAAREFAQREPALMQQLIDRLVEATIEYLNMQIEAGAEALQLFDSWAGLLTPEQFTRWVIPPTKKIAEALRSAHPEIPLIGFAKGAGAQLPAYAKETGVDCIGVDQDTTMEFALGARARKKQAVQGNLDPLLLARDKEGALRETEKILKTLADEPCVFNVGHGFIPETPIENVAAVSALVKSWER